MAQSSNTVELVFRANNLASGPINRIAQDVQGLGRSIQAGPLGALGRLSTSFGALAGAAGVGLVVRGFKQAVSAAAEADQSFRQMASSVELAGSSMAKSGAQIQATIGRLFDATTYDDEALQDAFSKLVTMTDNVADSLKALPVVVDLAAKANIDLQSAVQTVGLAVEGATRGLKRLGISFTEAQQKAFLLMTEAERLNITLGLIGEKTSGAAAVNLASWGGELQQLSRGLGEAWEDVGGFIFTALEAMDRYFTRLKIAIRDLAGLGGAQGQGIVSGARTSIGLGLPDPANVPSGAAARGLLAMATDLAGWNTQAEKARATTQGWTSDAAQLAESIKDLSRNVVDVTRRTGDSGAGIAAYSDEILRLAADADRLGVTFSAAFKKMVAAAEELRAAGLPQLPQGMTLEQYQRFTTGQTASPVLNLTGMQAATDRIMAGIAEDLKRAAEEAGRVFVEHFQRPMTDIFTDLALTGGANFGRIAGQMFEQAVRGGAESFVSLISRGLSTVFGGGQVTGNAETGFFINGQPATEAQATAAQQRNGRVGQVAGAVVGAGVQFANVVGQSGGQRQSALATVASFTAAGASVGGWIGAIAGAVVGGVAALLAPPQGRDYSYGRYGVRGGQAFFDYSSRGGDGGTGQLQNISGNAARMARSQLEQAFGDAYGDFVRIMLRFPTEVLPATFAQIGEILPRVGTEAGGDMGRAASADFWKDFELWFRQGMPLEMASRFRPVFAQAFEGMGFTIARFNEIWTSLQDLDPAEARALLDQWAQAATELPEAFEFLRQPFGGRGGGLDWAQREMRRSPADRLTEAYDPILRLANTLGNLPIAEQIRGWAEVNRQIQEVQQNFRDLLLEIAEGIRSVTESYGSSIRELEIAGIRTPEGEPDYQGQAEYLRRYANDLRARIGSAATPAEALALGEELRGTIMQIYQLGQQLGPEAGEQFRLWALGALEEGRDAVIESLRVIGEEAAAENQRNLALLQAQWEGFTGAAAEATNDFTAALIAATSAIKNLLRGGGDGGDRGGDFPEIPIAQPTPKDAGGAFMPGSAIVDRLERIERAIAENASRAAQINAAGQSRIENAIRSTPPTVVPYPEPYEVPVQGGGAGPSSRRGR